MMEEKNKIINAGLIYMIGNIMIKGVSFLTIPLYTRLMPTVDYGVYNTYVAYVSIVTFFVCLGLDPTLKNAEYDFKDKKDTYLSNVYYLTMFASIFLLFLVWIGKDILAEILSIDNILLILIVIQAEASAIINIYNVKLSLSYSGGTYLKISFFNTICGICLSIFFILNVFPEKTYWGRIIGSIIPIVIVAVLLVYKYVIVKKRKFNKQMAKYGLKIGLPLIPHLLSQIVNSQFDRIMISNMVGYAQAGIYSFTYNIAIILQIIYQSLDNIWSTWFFKAMQQKKYGEIKINSKKYIMIITFFTVSLLTISREFIMLFSTQDYWAGIDLSFPLIVGIFFLFLYTLPAGVEYFKKKTQYIAKGSVLTAILNIILNYYMILYFGYEAAAYTTLVSYVFLFCIHWIIYRHLLKEEIFSLLFIVKCVGIVLIWALTCFYFQKLWQLRYICYVFFVMYILYYFKNDIEVYIKILKNKNRSIC